ncbi:MAG: S8 family serine peptidase, partial [Crinalium sp.]
VFSGTSAAAPQIAGICALLKQVDPNLSPARVKQILQQTAIDVTEGFSHPSTGGASARAGVDLATGYGLADAYASVEAIKALTSEKCCDDCASSVQNFSKLNSTTIRRKPMSSEFPKLYAKMDEIQVKLNEFLKKEFIDIEKPIIEDVELLISEANFVSPSPQTRAISSLIKLLTNLPKDESEKLANIEKRHVLAAESLIRMQRSQELAMSVLVTAISSTKKKVPELAAKALGEFGVQDYVSSFDNSCSSDMCCRITNDKKGNPRWIKNGRIYDNSSCT